MRVISPVSQPASQPAESYFQSKVGMGMMA